jgi:hypothetical protein
MKAQHTPGPWKVEWCPVVRRFEITAMLDGSTATIARLLRQDHRLEASEAANAKLIAAAPDLHKALHRLFCEATHYAQTGKGKQFLESALLQAMTELEKVDGGDK